MRQPQFVKGIYMIKGAIFDVDGTILESAFVWRKVIDNFLLSQGVVSDDEMYEQIATLDLKQGCLYIKKRYSLAQSCEEMMNNVIDSLSDFYKKQVGFKKYIPEYLESLRQKGIVCTVATAGDTSLVRPCFERLGIIEYFSEIFSCSQIDTDKSKPDIYLYAAKYMNTIPAETVVYEDAPHALKSAKNAGFKTVGIYSDECENTEDVKENSDRFIYSYSELLESDII